MSTIFGKSRGLTTALPVYEGYGVEINGDLIALQESFDDQIQIIKSIHSMDSAELEMQREVSALESAGASQSEIAGKVAVYEASIGSAVKNVWEKIKTMFKKLWAKLKAFFATVVRYFDYLFKSSADFIKKYEAQLRKLNTSGFEYKMFNYTNLDNFQPETPTNVREGLDEIFADIAAITEANVDKVKEDLEKMKEAKDEVLDEARAGVVPGSGSSLSADEYKEALFAAFRDGAKDDGDKEDRKVDLNEIIKVLKDTKGKKTVEDLIKKTDEEFNKIIKAIETAETKLAGAKEKDGSVTHTFNKGKPGEATGTYGSNARTVAIESLNFAGSLTNGLKEIEMEAHRAWRSAWEERDRTYKAAAMAAFRYKKKD